MPAAAVPETAALDVAVAHAMLRRTSRATVEGRESPELLRIHRPEVPAVAFGRRDLRLPGFGAAATAARAAGFAPVVRAPGGRAVAYTPEALVVDHVSPDPQWPSGLEARFDAFGQLWTGLLTALGVDARVGEVPGEYCPGSHSVNARGVVKLVGTAQRMVRGAWLFSAVLVHGGADELRPLLGEVYGALGLPFDVVSVGSLTEEAPGTSLDHVEAAVRAAYESRLGLAPLEVDPGLHAEAHALLGEHVVDEQGVDGDGVTPV